MKFTILLFLLLFIQAISVPNSLTTEFVSKVWVYRPGDTIRKDIYDAATKVNHKEGYIFAYVQENRCDVIYWAGDKLATKYKIFVAKSVVLALTEAFENYSSLDIYITRKPDDSKFRTYGDIVSAADVIKKIPRLYEIEGTDIIKQVPIQFRLIKRNNWYIFYDGVAVTVYYHTQSKDDTNVEDDTKTEDDTKRKIAKSLAKYIVKFEKIENNSIFYLNDVEESQDAAKKSFIKKITAFHNPRSKSNHISKKQNKLTKSSNAANFELNKEVQSIHGFTFGPPECKFKEQSPEIDRLISKTKKEVDIFLNQITLFIYKKKNCVIVCPKKPPYIVIISGIYLKKCIYVIQDHENEELFIYIGKDTQFYYQYDAFNFGENKYLFTHVKLTFLVERNLLPPAFIIHVKSKIENLLKDSS